VALPPTTVPGGIDDQFCPISGFRPNSRPWE
jgi:hypothetical protein